MELSPTAKFTAGFNEKKQFLRRLQNYRRYCGPNWVPDIETAPLSRNNRKATLWHICVSPSTSSIGNCLNATSGFTLAQHLQNVL